MRQSDGSEILGPKDPRNIVIGIIHVSPNDDRQSVITAIATQDKMGRDQIVLELPAQNKSFNSAVDFAGLHQMAGEIEATIVLVAPQRSKIANLARKESFTVYPSLDELTTAEFPTMEPEETEAQANGTAMNAAPVENDEMDRTALFPVTPSAEPASPTPPISAGVLPETPPPATEAAAGVPEEPEISQAQIPTTSLPAPEEDEDETPTDPSLRQVNPSAQTSAQVGNGGQVVEGQVVPPGSYLPVPLPTNSSALVPTGSQLPMYYEPIELPHRRRSWRGWIITGIIVLLLIGMGVLFYRPILDLIFPPTATVTIIPSSQQVQQTYQMTAVLGVPDPTKNQVDARALYADSQTQSETVKATGQGRTSGKQAQGVLTFYNTSTSAQTISAGTVIFDNNGIAVVNDNTINLPALNPADGLGSLTGLAHTVNVGSAQNIPANDFNDQLCCGGSIYVSNTEAFTGGEDLQTFTYVQQSDIDGVVQSLSASLTQQATLSLQGQVRSNERPVGTPHCAPQETSNHLAGTLANTVTVSVTISCVGEVYDMQAVQALAANELTQYASKHPGPAYVPVGDILSQVTQAISDKSGNIHLVVNAGGIWAYQFTPAQHLQFANLIAGKSSQDAKTLLQQQTGVAPNGVTITLTGVGVTSVPDNTDHITINIEAVQGLHP